MKIGYKLIAQAYAPQEMVRQAARSSDSRQFQPARSIRAQQGTEPKPERFGKSGTTRQSNPP